MPDVSVIVPNLNSPLIGEVFAALQTQTAVSRILEVIVVGIDDARLLRPDPLLQQIDTIEPVSAARARNLGAAAARGVFLLFLDADCLLAPHALQHLLATADQYAALVGGVVPEAGAYWRLCSNLLAFPEFLSSDAAGERACLPSFCLLITRQAWQEHGGFDEGFGGAAGEDLDLSFRMRRQGLTLGCQPAARVYHRPARSGLAAVWRRHRAYGAAWYRLYPRYPEMMPVSQAIWLVEQIRQPLGLLWVLACLYILRLSLQRGWLPRFWYTLPGLVLLQFAWYQGMHLAAQQRARSTSHVVF